MKKLLLAFSFSLFSFCLFSQVNDYFVNNPTWVCYFERYPWPCVKIDSLNYYLNGDSIVNSTTYKVLYTRGRYIEFSQGPPMCIPQNYTYQNTVSTGLLRSQGLQIYYIPDQDSAEYLLYDFNLTIGSHLPLTYVNTDTSYVVTYIDSIYTAAGYRQRYFLNGSSAEYLIEGVGSSAGLLYPLGILFESNASLVCYSQNDTAWFPSQGPGCSIITASPAQVQVEMSLELVPNPATEYVDVNANGFSVGSIVVYDVFGRVVKHELPGTKIFVGDLAAGVYTCVVASGETRISKLLIVE